MRPQIGFLSIDEQEQTHQAALWLLENVGMRFPLREAVDIMRDAGAKVEENYVVKIPGELVSYALENAPKRDGFVLYGRAEKYDIIFGQHTPTLCSMLMTTHIIDLETRERRLCRESDLANIVRLVDALDNIGVNAPLALPREFPKETADWYALAVTLNNTSKHIVSRVAGAEYVKDALRMGSLAVGSEVQFRERPFISFEVLTSAPFQIDRLSLESLIEISRQKLPTCVSSGPILGVTSPVTIAGAVAQVHAEVLACIVLSQLVGPGTPIMYTSFARSMDMKTVSVSMAGPEFSILKGAIGQMGHYIGLPVRMPAFLRDAKTLDAQAGFESGTVGLVSALCADIIDGLQYDMDTLIDFADLVFSNEAMGALKRISRGFTIDDNTLALNVIQEVGHGGSFLSKGHTLNHFRNELWIPHLMERRSWAQWEKDGRKNIEQRAIEETKRIIANQRPVMLKPEVQAEINKIADQAKLH